MNLEMERIALLADRLHLPQLTASLPLLAEEAARKEQSYSEFLVGLLEEEVRAADIRAQDMMLRLASFPFRRTLEDFDFSFQPSVSQKQLREFAGCALCGAGGERHHAGASGSGQDPSGRGSGARRHQQASACEVSPRWRPWSPT